MKIDYKKIIISTVLWTFTFILLFSAIFLIVMIFAFPKNLGDFFYSIGSNRFASSLYYRVYEKEDNIYYCYKSLSIEIGLENEENIIKYYEDFVSDENYSDFMQQLQEHNEKQNVTLLAKSTLLNENNFLTNQYIGALIDNDQIDKAYNVALNCFKDYNSFTFKNQGVYALYQFNELSNYNDLYSMPEGYSLNLIESLQDYFEKSFDLFNEKKSSDNELDKAYLISLGNRIIQVGQNTNAFYSNHNETNLISTNKECMNEVNNVIKEIL